MWVWDQSEGKLYRDNVFVARGYSGHGEGKNNPDKETVRSVGPIPAGMWQIVGVYNSPRVGPFTLDLRAIDAIPNDDIHQRTGRSAFRIHGDSARNPGSASRGCIILPRSIREKIWYSGDHTLQVKA